MLVTLRSTLNTKMTLERRMKCIKVEWETTHSATFSTCMVFLAYAVREMKMLRTFGSLTKGAKAASKYQIFSIIFCRVFLSKRITLKKWPTKNSKQSFIKTILICTKANGVYFDITLSCSFVDVLLINLSASYWSPPIFVSSSDVIFWESMVY